MSDLKAWSDAANNLFAPGCESQSLVLLASFGSPLMGFFPTPEGAVVSIWGPRHRGKTTAGIAAETAWGADPEAPAVLTKMGNRDPSIARQLLADACGRKLLTISVSPLPLVAMEGLGIEVKCTIPAALCPAKRDGSLAMSLRENRGTAIPPFMVYLKSAQDWVREQLASKVALMRKETGADNIYALRAIACCWVAGMMAARLEILAVDPERVARWAMKQALRPASAKPVAAPSVRQSDPAPPLEAAFHRHEPEC